MSKSSGPTLPRRRIARDLKQLREEQHASLIEVAEKTAVSTSTLSRLENAQGAANKLTILALVDFYKLADTPHGERLLRWAKDGRKPGWWQDFPAEATENTALYVSYETQAAVAKMYVIPFMPVLLQTAEYAKTIAKAFNPKYDEEGLHSLVRFRQRRKQILEGAEGQAPLQLHVVLHESCLAQVVGTRDTMRDQLQHLLDVSADRDNVHLQVLTRDSPPHRAMRCLWSHFEYADPDEGDITFVETHVGLLTPYEDQTSVEQAKIYFSELSEQSLSEEDTVEFIRNVQSERFS
jgi:transcriptional regulator with XRE-family HTH domain